MIRGYVLGFNRPNRETRYGDAELIRSNRGKYNLLIDGYCGSGADKLIAYLKKKKIKDLWLALSHPHYDHSDCQHKIIKDTYFNVKCLYCCDPETLKSGLRNNRGSQEVKKDIKDLENLIAEAKARGIKVVFLKHLDKITIGDIKINIYRQQPKYVEDDDTQGWSYVNDGSLCFYFPQLYYWTSGDGPEKICDFIKNLGLKALRNYCIPVPPLSEQRRIVAILDRFDKLCNDISEGLPAEIEARQKQYEYYRDTLLTFAMKE